MCSRKNLLAIAAAEARLRATSAVRTVLATLEAGAAKKKPKLTTRRLFEASKAERMHGRDPHLIGTLMHNLFFSDF